MTIAVAIATVIVRSSHASYYLLHHHFRINSGLICLGPLLCHSSYFECVLSFDQSHSALKFLCMWQRVSLLGTKVGS